MPSFIMGGLRYPMTLKTPHRLASSLVGLLGLVGVGAAAPALASNGAAAQRAAVAAKRATAGAAKNRFLAAHPLAGSPGTGYCYIDVPHVHDYVPDRPAVYQQVGDEYVFTGDPVPFGYEGEKTVFYVGPIPPEVARERPQRERAVEIEYQPYVAQRPQVVVSPPPESRRPRHSWSLPHRRCPS